MFSSLDLTGARSILTGASSGIGRALTGHLAKAGARVVIASRNRERLDALAEECRARGGEVIPVPCDVTAPGGRERLIGRAAEVLGGLDVLVNNAGVGATGFFEGADEERLRKIFEVNFFGATELTRLALPYLVHGRNPMIVNVASVLGRRAIPGCTEYCASKFALVGWSEGLRAELAPRGVHVLVVCPGGVETEFDANMLEKGSRVTRAGRRRMSADRCARLIVRAMRKRKNEAVITAEATLALGLNRLAPRLLDWVMARYARRVR